LAYDSTNTTNIGFGAVTNGTCGFFTGELDEVSVWSVVRTAQEIAQDMAGPLKGTETGLEGYWDFNATACGLTAVDRSGHGRDAMLGGSATANTSDPTWVADGPF
jgi:hypothetical protein